MQHITSVTNRGLLVDNSVWKCVIHVAMLSSKNSGKSYDTFLHMTQCVYFTKAEMESEHRQTQQL